MATHEIKGFVLAVDVGQSSDSVLQDGLSAIQTLNGLSDSCSSVAAMLNDGCIPSDLLITQVSCASVAFSGLAQNVTDLLSKAENSGGK